MRTSHFLFLSIAVSGILTFASCDKDEETDGIVAVFTADQFNQQTCTYLDSLSSPNGTQPTSILFQNETSKTLKIYWINFSGGLTPYHELAAGEEANQNTFLQHPWYITTADEECVTILTALRPAVTDTIVFQN